jgi:Protein of unknown function (DUF1572)
MPDSSKQSSTVIAAAIGAFHSQKRLADGAINQTSDENLRRPLDPNTNSIAIIMKHLGGNMVSRWTDFLTTDGNKPSRDRDNEFIDDFPNRAAILDHWERGWSCLFDALGKLTDADLFKTITIRTEPHNVIDAINRSLSHTGYHVGQIVQAARVLAGDNWTVLTVPRGGTKEHDEQIRQRFGHPRR